MIQNIRFFIKEAARVLFHTEDVPRIMVNVERLISLYGKNGYSVGDQLTWADIVFFFIVEMGKIEKSGIEKFPHSLKVLENVENHPKIAAYIKSRPESAW